MNQDGSRLPGGLARWLVARGVRDRALGGRRDFDLRFRKVGGEWRAESGLLDVQIILAVSQRRGRYGIAQDAAGKLAIESE